MSENGGGEMNFQYGYFVFFAWITDFLGAGLWLHQLYAARPEHSGMVVLRSFLPASRMGMATFGRIFWSIVCFVGHYSDLLSIMFQHITERILLQDLLHGINGPHHTH